jgi:uncharacterized protein
MRSAITALLLLASTFTACGRDSWPEPPAIDASAYQKEYDGWLREQQQVGDILAIVGIWPLAEGDTALGSDRALPIVLPASVSPARAGILHRAGEMVTIVPAPGSALHLPDGASVSTATAFVDGMTIGSVSLGLNRMPGGRLFVIGIDQAHPALTHPPEVPAFPPAARWRVAARFDAFDRPRPINVSDVRGGTVDFVALGQLVFRLQNHEWRLTALSSSGGPPDEPFFVMFKDQTNGTSTYGGYRILTPPRVKPGEFTVLDFNMASNPPCAYSPYTTCPLPPPENRLDIAVDAGLKRLPSVPGFVTS